MRAPRLLVIQHELDDHLNELGGPFADAGLVIEPWLTNLRPGPELDVAEYDGVVTLGAVPGVLDEATYPWMTVERQVLEKAVAGGTPTLGICFGAQMLASVGGAPVRRATVPEIGWTEVEMDPSAAGDPLLRVLGPRPHVFHFHHDTFGEPEQGSILGRTGDINEVARIGERAWAVQFHIEVNPGTIQSWLGTYGDGMRGDGADLDAIAKETADRWEQYRRLARAFGDAFAAEVTGFAAGRS